MLGGQTQAPGLVQAFIHHENGRRYERGLKPESELTSLERYSMGFPLNTRQHAELRAPRRRPIG